MTEKGKIFYDPRKDISITEPVKIAIKLLNICSINGAAQPQKEIFDITGRGGSPICKQGFIEDTELVFREEN